MGLDSVFDGLAPNLNSCESAVIGKRLSNSARDRGVLVKSSAPNKPYKKPGLCGAA
jgi:hypothetical protein